MKIRLSNILASAALALLLGFPSSAAVAEGPAMWSADILVSYNYELVRVNFGADESATDWFENRWDSRAMRGDRLNAYFYHPEWGQSTPYFWREIKTPALPKEWPFYVESRYSRHDLNWDLSNVPATVELELVDDYAGVSVNMRTQSSYSYNSTSPDPRPFRVVASGSIDGWEAPVDAVPPDTEITTAVPAFLDSTSLTVEFAGTDDLTPAGLLTYSYSVDNGASWSAWASDTAVALTGLAQGPHGFSVKARDQAGKEDLTPATVGFTVDTIVPALALGQPDPIKLWPSNGRMVDVLFTGNVSDSGSGLDTVYYTMVDEYGEFAYSGTVVPDGTGNFSFYLSLKSERARRDPDRKRTYTVTVTATDMAGKAVSGTVYVYVTPKIR